MHKVKVLEKSTSWVTIQRVGKDDRISMPLPQPDVAAETSELLKKIVATQVGAIVPDVELG